MKASDLLKSRTFWGAVLVAASSLVNAPAIGFAEVTQAAGVVLAAIGVRARL
jgi:hypothetical protein